VKILCAIALAAAACGGSKSSPAPTTCGAPTTAPTPAGAKEIAFPAGDGVTVTADVYMPNPATAPFVVLFHQAGYSRGEYRAIAPKLVALGVNAMAVDLRSGEAAAGVGNATAASACALGKPHQYVDAVADLTAAVAKARELARGKVVLWGSSYSSSLVLAYGGELHADAVMAFSPGEYFDDQGKSKTWVAERAATLAVPVFIASARSEAATWAPIAAAITRGKVTTFVPDTAGLHGASALWPEQPDNGAYWTAVTAFVAAIR
jgi:dienelactone hydrolase